MVAASTRLRSVLRARRALDAEAESLVQRAKSAWPKIKVDPKEFVAHVARRIDDAEDVGAALDDLHAADLWLAFACGKGDRIAIAQLDRELGSVVSVALARMRDKVAPDDVSQLLRERLLVTKTSVGAGGEPKIFEYSGRGPLAGWIRIAAVRTALSLTRRGDGAGMQPVTREMLLAIPATSADPEMAHLRKRYAREFKQAFEDALAELTPEDRNVLRLSIVDGLSIDEIGLVFGVHRATAARHLARSRETLMERTRDLLGERLRVGKAELQSIMGYIRSHLDLSIQRLLVEQSDAQADKIAMASKKKRRARGQGLSAK